MSIAASVRSISPVARSLTEGGRMVAFKSAFAPATEVAQSLQNPVRPNLLAFSVRVAMESEDQIADANEVIVGADAQAIDDQVGSLSNAVNTMVYTARNVIVPTIDGLVQQYVARQSGSFQPNVSVNAFKYHGVHSEPALVNHIASKYAQVVAQPNYRTFILNGLSAEAIVTLVAENNPHLESSQVVEWLLEMGAERILAVWAKLYGTSREFDFSSASWMSPASWPLQIDELLLAYCLTGALREAPQEVTAESVDLQQWELVLGNLHELIGSKLLQAYQYRAQDAKNQRLVLNTDGKDAMRTGTVAVLVNGDVYNGWLQAGGDVQALLSVAVHQPNLKNVAQINPVADELVAQWTKYYPVLRQACLDNGLRNRRRDVVAVFLNNTTPAVEGLPQIDTGVAAELLDNELRAIDDEEYEKPYLLFAGLVCRIYYPNQRLYFGFMRAMDRYAKVHPGASGRELAIEATIELVATYLADQMITVQYTPEVDPNAVALEDEGVANVKIDNDNAEIAEDLGEIQAPVETDEVAAAQAEGELDAEGNPVTPAEGDSTVADDFEPAAGEQGTDSSELPDDGQSAGFEPEQPEAELPASGEAPVEPEEEELPNEAQP
ncbi:hypothetical protein D3C81_316670 [compost metagenome]